MEIGTVQGISIAIGIVPALFVSVLCRVFWHNLAVGYRLKVDGTHPDYEDLDVALHRYDMVDEVWTLQYLEYARDTMRASLNWLEQAGDARASAKAILDSVDNVNFGNVNEAAGREQAEQRRKKSIQGLSFRKMRDGADSLNKYAELMEKQMELVDKHRTNARLGYWKPGKVQRNVVSSYA